MVNSHAVLTLSCHQLALKQKQSCRPILRILTHVTRHDSLSKTILQGTLEGGWCRGWQRKCWMENIKEWTSLPMLELLTMACRKHWKTVCVELPIMSPPMTQLVKGLTWTVSWWVIVDTKSSKNPELSKVLSFSARRNSELTNLCLSYFMDLYPSNFWSCRSFNFIFPSPLQT